MKSYLLVSMGFVAICAVPAIAQVPLTTNYYPLKVGNRWTYRSIDVKNDPNKKDEAKRRFPKVVIEVDREEIHERMIKNKNNKDVPEKVAGFLLKSTSGGKTTFDHVIVLEGGVHRISVGGTPTTAPVPITPPLLFFKLPLKPGDTWPIDSKIGNKDIKGVFTTSRQIARVPAGEFDAFVISHRDGPMNNTRIEIDYWFTAGLGMVKQRIKTNNSETILELERFDAAK